MYEYVDARKAMYVNVGIAVESTIVRLPRADCSLTHRDSKIG